MLYRASPSLECCRDSWCCSCCLSAACCCPPFAFVGCLSKTSLKNEVSWSQHGNQRGSKLSVRLKAFHVTIGSEEVGVHTKKLGETSCSKNCKSCGSSESFESGFIPSSCHLRKTWLFIAVVTVLSFQVLFWSCGYMRKQYSNKGKAVATELPSQALSDYFKILCSEKYHQLQSILKIYPGLNQVICFCS